MNDAERARRAADGLCEVAESIRQVDYNALMERDLLRLMEAWEDVTAMTRHYREGEHAASRVDGGGGPP